MRSGLVVEYVYMKNALATSAGWYLYFRLHSVPTDVGVDTTLSNLLCCYLTVQSCDVEDNTCL